MLRKCCCVVDAQGYFDMQHLPFVEVESKKGDYSDAQINAYTLKDDERLVDAVPPLDMIKPRWNDSEWEETATTEEIEAAKPEPSLPASPSMEERLSILEALELERILREE